MKKIMVITIISLLVIGSIGAVGTHVDNDIEKDCDYCEVSVGLSDDDILSIQAQIEADGLCFTVGKNSATEKSIDQLCGLIVPDDWQDDVEFDPCVSALGIPSSFDWRDPKGHKGATWDCTTPIKHQQCGDCWAFGTVAPLESAILIEDHIEEDLSEQWLKSCNTNGYSCNGGWWAHQWHAGTNGKCGGTGAVLESNCPYKSTTGTCSGPYEHKYLIEKWAYIGGEHSVPSSSSLKNAIYEYGPISAAVYVNSAFQAYTGGIFDGTASGRVNHAVVLVGWNDNGNYWILRNSWGTTWGESGYMRIKYGSQQIGYAACYVDGYTTQFSGEESITLQLKEVTNQGDDYEPIDVNILLQPEPPEWLYKVELGENFKATVENLNPDQGGEGNIWPFDNFQSEYTWDIDADTNGHIIRTENKEVDIKFGFYDWDAVTEQDHADISPKSSRDFVGKYNLVTDVLKFSDGTVLEKSGGVYTIKGPKTSDWKCDNAKVKFDIIDSFDSEDHPPELNVPDSYSFGEKSKFGSFTGSFDVKNTQTHPWSDNLKFTASIDSGSDWISSVSPSTETSVGPDGSKTVTITTKNFQENGDFSGRIKISSNAGTEYVDVNIRIAKTRHKGLFLSELVESQFLMIYRLFNNLPILKLFKTNL